MLISERPLAPPGWGIRGGMRVAARRPPQREHPAAVAFPLVIGSLRQHLMRRRIAGMPDALIAFCQVMSGGLPRDLIRMARLVVEACAQGQEQISELTLSVVLGQIALLKRS